MHSYSNHHSTMKYVSSSYFASKHLRTSPLSPALIATLSTLSIVLRSHFYPVYTFYCKVAFLAPTRILALQHLRVLRTRMPDVNIQLLRGGGKGDALKVKEMIKNGECEVGDFSYFASPSTFCHFQLSNYVSQFCFLSIF